MSKLARTILVSSLVSVAACSSISGHRVTADGKTDVGGLPIVVQRHTRAIWLVTQIEYAIDTPVIENGVVTDMTTESATETTVSDKPILLGPSEVYTIDPKRPALGTSDWSVELTNHYPTKLGAKVEDKTLSEFSDTLSGIANKLFGVDVQEQSGESATRREVSRTTKMIVFDLEQGTHEIIQL